MGSTSVETPAYQIGLTQSQAGDFLPPERLATVKIVEITESITEGGDAIVEIVRTGVETIDCAVSWTITNPVGKGGLSAPLTGVTLIDAGVTVVRLNLPSDPESGVSSGNRNVTITLSEPLGCVIDPTQSAATIIIMDALAASVSIAVVGSVTVTEGNTTNTILRFRVSKSDIEVGCSVGWTREGELTSDDFAVAEASGAVTFAEDEFTQDITFTLKADTLVEGDERCIVTLRAPVNCSIGVGSATITVVNDDSDTWFKLPNRSGRLWPSGPAYWYDRPITGGTDLALPRFKAEEFDIALIDAFSGSTKGDGLKHVNTFYEVIGGNETGAMDETDTQFDFRPQNFYGLGNGLTYIPIGPDWPDGSCWVIWVVTFIPTDRTTEDGDESIWDEIIAGTHDPKWIRFGIRFAAKVLSTGIPAKRWILDAHHEMNQSNAYQVFAGTRNKYMNAMNRIIQKVREGAGFRVRFSHRPAYRPDPPPAVQPGPYNSYIPSEVDCLGLSMHPDSTVTTAAQVDQLFAGTLNSRYYGTADVLSAAIALNKPIIFNEWSPKFEAGDPCPVSDIFVQKFYNNVLYPNRDRLIADCVYHQNVRDARGYLGTDSGGKVQWVRFKDSRKGLWTGSQVINGTLPRTEWQKKAEFTGTEYFVSPTGGNSLSTNRSSPGGLSHAIANAPTLSKIIMLGSATRYPDVSVISSTARKLWITPENKPFSCVDTSWTPATVYDLDETNNVARTGNFYMEGFGGCIVEGLWCDQNNKNFCVIQACTGEFWVMYCRGHRNHQVGISFNGCQTVVGFQNWIFNDRLSCNNGAFTTRIGAATDFGFYLFGNSLAYITKNYLQGLFRIPIGTTLSNGKTYIDNNAMYLHASDTYPNPFPTDPSLAGDTESGVYGMVLGEQGDETGKEYTCGDHEITNNKWSSLSAHFVLFANAKSAIIRDNAVLSSGSVLWIDSAPAGTNKRMMGPPYPENIQMFDNDFQQTGGPKIQRYKTFSQPMVVNVYNNTVATLGTITDKTTGHGDLTAGTDATRFTTNYPTITLGTNSGFGVATGIIVPKLPDLPTSNSKIRTVGYDAPTGGTRHGTGDSGLTAALTAALPGDEIRLADGNYTIDRTITKSGSATNGSIVITSRNHQMANIIGLWELNNNYMWLTGLQFSKPGKDPGTGGNPTLESNTYYSVSCNGQYLNLTNNKVNSSNGFHINADTGNNSGNINICYNDFTPSTLPIYHKGNCIFIGDFITSSRGPDNILVARNKFYNDVATNAGNLTDVDRNCIYTGNSKPDDNNSGNNTTVVFYENFINTQYTKRGIYTKRGNVCIRNFIRVITASGEAFTIRSGGYSKTDGTVFAGLTDAKRGQWNGNNVDRGEARLCDTDHLIINNRFSSNLVLDCGNVKINPETLAHSLQHQAASRTIMMGNTIVGDLELGPLASTASTKLDSEGGNVTGVKNYANGIAQPSGARLKRFYVDAGTTGYEELTGNGGYTPAPFVTRAELEFTVGCD